MTQARDTAIKGGRPAARSRAHAAVVLATLVAGLITSTPARADVAAAARAFADGQAAQLDGNYERAAQNFELAYHISPSKEALRGAIRARQLNGQLARAATLAQELMTKYADDATSARLASDVLAEARVKLARLVVTCTPQCSLSIDGRVASLETATTQIVFVPPGRQSVAATFEGDQSVTRELTPAAGEDVALSLAQPPARHAVPARKPAAPATPPAGRPASGLSPMVALAGGVVTLSLAGLATWSGLDTEHAHDAYVAAPTSAGWSDGRSKQLRTNLLAGGAVAAAVGTIVVAAFWTRWHGSPDAPADLALAPLDGGVAVSLGGRF